MAQRDHRSSARAWTDCRAGRGPFANGAVRRGRRGRGAPPWPNVPFARGEVGTGSSGRSAWTKQAASGTVGSGAGAPMCPLGDVGGRSRGNVLPADVVSAHQPVDRLTVVRYCGPHPARGEAEAAAVRETARAANVACRGLTPRRGAGIQARTPTGRLGWAGGGDSLDHEIELLEGSVSARR